MGRTVLAEAHEHFEFNVASGGAFRHSMHSGIGIAVLVLVVHNRNDTPPPFEICTVGTMEILCTVGQYSAKSIIVPIAKHLPLNFSPKGYC